MTQTKWIAAAALLALLAGGWFGLREWPREPALRMASEGVETLPDFAFADLEGTTRSRSDWEDHNLVINFWATWCPPCREEIPLLIEMQDRYRDRGVQFIGIAIDDPELVRDFSDVYGINFPVLVGGVDAVKLANTLGNRFDSLPFTAIFDRSGTTRYVHAGALSRDTLEQQLRPLR